MLDKRAFDIVNALLDAEEMAREKAKAAKEVMMQTA